MSYNNAHSICLNIPPLLGPPYVILSGIVTINGVDIESNNNSNENVLYIDNGLNINLYQLGIYSININISFSFIDPLGDIVYLSLLDSNMNSTNNTLLINLYSGTLSQTNSCTILYNNTIPNNIINLQLSTLHGIAYRINSLNIIKK